MIYLLCALLFDSAIGKDDDMNWKKLLGMYGIVLVGVIVINGALLAGAIWLVVTILKTMGVI